ncbi:unnamed protein product [Meloidogyne enterolobii]|uniref:Uncharacterized protein n=1 Tax=Meloidogyne enterolobii TaxID=390850 RepID=A0ACB0YT84_MELEN
MEKEKSNGRSQVCLVFFQCYFLVVKNAQRFIYEFKIQLTLYKVFLALNLYFIVSSDWKNGKRLRSSPIKIKIWIFKKGIFKFSSAT